MSKPKKQTAMGLIAAKLQARISSAPLTQAQKIELLAVLEHNDSAPAGQRVGARPVVDMLRGMGWTGGREALDTVCRNQLGRKGFSAP